MTWRKMLFFRPSTGKGTAGGEQKPGGGCGLAAAGGGGALGWVLGSPIAVLASTGLPANSVVVSRVRYIGRWDSTGTAGRRTAATTEIIVSARCEAMTRSHWRLPNAIEPATAGLSQTRSRLAGRFHMANGTRSGNLRLRGRALTATNKAVRLSEVYLPPQRPRYGGHD